MSQWTLEPCGPLKGRIRVPGDKSISHRSLLFNALGQGEALITGLLRAGDVMSTWACLSALGVEIEDLGGDGLGGDGLGGDGLGGTVRVKGSGGRLKEPSVLLDCGNSGTSFRLLCGLLSGQDFFSVLTGDKHLKKRPMRRVTGPLSAMGARFWGPDNASRPPLGVQGGALVAGDYTSPIASAQVKTALMLAAIQGSGCLRFKEPHRSRDHSERMLRAMGVEIRDEAGVLVVPGKQSLVAQDVVVPGDISAAAFFMVGACIVPGSDLTLLSVGLNPTRSGIVDALVAMGADLQVVGEREVSGEKIADIRIRYSGLKGTRIDGALIPRLVDELPVLAVAAACAQGETVFADAAELRVKESDRIAATAAGLIANGIDVQEHPDGMTIQGGRLSGGLVDASGDHRIAMAFAMAALAGGPSQIDDVDNVATSFPSFRSLLAEVTRG
jgi:3-phosphoshikimate 1-carboxyvinyltransferase